MGPILGEFIGTAILLLLGNGVVANVVLNKTKGNDSGWFVITFGWGMAVFTAVFVVGQFSGAHINPAVTVGLATAGLFEWGLVFPYIAMQMLGAAFGAFLVWLAYKNHFDATEDGGAKLAVHCTAPEIRSYGWNFTTEAIGTLVLVFGVFFIANPGFIDGNGQMLDIIVINGQEVGFGLGALAALPVGLLVLAIGLSLGGPTGYAINPARDLGPRVMHAILPIPNKGSNDWAYSWVPVFGPIAGAIIAAGVYMLL